MGRVRLTARRSAREAVVAGGIAAVLSGIPSTTHAILTGRDPLEATRAAGSLVLRNRPARARSLVVAGAAAHVVLSLGWALVLAGVLPRRPRVVHGVVAGAAIAAHDLGVVGRRVPRVAALPLIPQVADHALYGVLVGLGLRWQRGRAAA